MRSLARAVAQKVNDDWVLRKLEGWGKRDGMPFLGPKKGAILQQLVQQQQPQLAVEVGSMAGYSAILIAQVWESDSNCIASSPPLLLDTIQWHSSDNCSEGDKHAWQTTMPTHLSVDWNDTNS
jgi:hypothetical protein